MKTSPAQTAIAERTARIAALQDEIKIIQTAESLVKGNKSPVPHGTRESEKSPRRAKPTRKQRWNPTSAPKPPRPVSDAPAGAVKTPLDKPDTIAGALKELLRDEFNPFTRAEVLANLQADADYQKLLAQYGEAPLDNALRNWTHNGYLEKASRAKDSQYTVTAKGRGWMTT